MLFSFLPINYSICVHKYRNQFLLNASNQYLKTCSADDLDTSKIISFIDDKTHNKISETIGNKITCIRFKVNTSMVSLEKYIIRFAKIAQHFRNSTKLSLEGLDGLYYFATSNEIQNSLLGLIKKCPNLSHIELINGLYIAIEDNYFKD